MALTSSSCGYLLDFEKKDASSSPSQALQKINFTSPVADIQVPDQTQNFTWDVIPSAAEYAIEIYREDDCSGIVMSQIRQTTNSIVRSTIFGSVSVKVIALNSSSQPVAEGCSPWVVTDFPGLVSPIKHLPVASALQLGNLVLYVSQDAENPVFGEELYAIDVTTGHKSLIKDIYVGPNSSKISLSGARKKFGKIFFNADDGTGAKIWESDGTAQGTQVSPIFTAMGIFDYNTYWIESEDHIFFGVITGPDLHLWGTDGTLANTRQIRKPDGTPPGVLSWGGGPIKLGSEFLFTTSSDGGATKDTWKTSLAANDAVLVKTNFSVVAYGPESYANLGSVVTFAGRSGNSDTELWKSSGTAGTTVLLSDICPGTANNQSSYPRTFFKASASEAFFDAAVSNCDNGGAVIRQFRTDGTVVELVSNISSGSINVIDLGGIVHFFREAAGGFYSLWKTSGTVGSTAVVKDFTGMPEIGIRSLNGGSTFIRNTSTNLELWTSDGSLAGTQLYKTMTGSTCHVYGYGSNCLGFFSDSNVFTRIPPDGISREIWNTDGTSAGTAKIGEISGGVEAVGDSVVKGPRPFKNFLMVPGTRGLYSVTLSTTERIAEGTFNWLSGGYFVSGQTADTFYFRIYDINNNPVIYKTDGTLAGTQKLIDLGTGYLYADHGDTNGLVELNGYLYFVFTDYTTTNLKKLNLSTLVLSNAGAIEATELIGVAGGKLFFSGNDGSGRKIWKYDDVTLSSSLVAAVTPSNYEDGKFNFKENIFFVGNTIADGDEMYKIDSSGGIVSLSAWLPAVGTDNPKTGKIALLGDSVYFGLLRGEILKWDGQTATPTLITDMSSSAFAYPLHFIACGGKIFFQADDGVNGKEVWTSDGTSSGTRMVHDLNPTGDTEIASMACQGNDLYFLGSVAWVPKLYRLRSGTLVPEIALNVSDWSFVKSLQNEILVFQDKGSGYGNQIYRLPRSLTN